MGQLYIQFKKKKSLPFYATKCHLGLTAVIDGHTHKTKSHVAVDVGKSWEFIYSSHPGLRETPACGGQLVSVGFLSRLCCCNEQLLQAFPHVSYWMEVAAAWFSMASFLDPG
jgi:hypothetical protein